MSPLDPAWHMVSHESATCCVPPLCQASVEPVVEDGSLPVTASRCPSSHIKNMGGKGGGQGGVEQEGKVGVNILAQVAQSSSGPTCRDGCGCCDSVRRSPSQRTALVPPWGCH